MALPIQCVNSVTPPFIFDCRQERAVEVGGNESETSQQRDAHERMQAQRGFRDRLLRLQHAHGLPIRTKNKKQ